jgi:hypothetical protein
MINSGNNGWSGQGAGRRGLIARALSTPQPPAQHGSNSPAFAEEMNACHLADLKTSAPPHRCLVSRTATPTPGTRAASTQAPLALKLDLNQPSPAICS